VSSVAIITGEASGDLHGSLLAKHLRGMRDELEIWGAGGRKMREAGVELIWESDVSGAIGVAEAIRLVPGLLLKCAQVKRELLARRPDVLILVDFGAFNKPIARFARRRGITTVYHMPPGAWRRRRLNRSLVELADKFITPFPWSYELLKEAGADVELIGHPLLDVVRPALTESEFCARLNLRPGDGVVGLLPGSRKQEITHILPEFLGAAKLIEAKAPGLQYVIAAAGKAQSELIERVRSRIMIGRGWPEIRIAEAMTYDVLARARLAITASGTATLEAAILNTPMIIAYRGSLLSHIEYSIRGKSTIEEHIGLPNIIAEKRICPELVSNQASSETIAQLAKDLLLDPSKTAAMKKELATAVSVLGESGGARTAAQVILRAMDQ